MNMTATQLFPQWGTYRKWHGIIGWLLAALLVLLWFTGHGPAWLGSGWACKAPVAPTVSAPTPPVVAAPAPKPEPIAAAPAPAPAAPAPAAPAPVAAAVALPPVARLYFDLDKFDPPAASQGTLAEVVAYLKANPSAKAVVSGYHDPSGNKAHNEELALNRARTVRTELDKAGISNDRVVMAKPIETTGTGAPAEARRVEVSVQQ